MKMTTALDKKFMKLAIRKARAGIKKGDAPFGACVVKNDKVVIAAHNIVVSNTDITAHAEIMAIRAACRKLKTIDLSGCVIYSTCEPCPMCFSACHWAKISKIIYGTKITDAKKKCGFSELAIPNTVMKKLGRSSMQIQGNFMRSDGMRLFDFWLKTGKGHPKAY